MAITSRMRTTVPVVSYLGSIYAKSDDGFKTIFGKDCHKQKLIKARWAHILQTPICDHYGTLAAHNQFTRIGIRQTWTAVSPLLGLIIMA